MAVPLEAFVMCVLTMIAA
ncbi:DUF1196 domain-containing protein [Vibrio cholerae]|nr:DUF1196 domain-containing protein [Vibrio cholerae]MCG3727825.1 DUF1196 domain-containing protein [Vibrio cincinnatiensis]